MEKRGTIGPLAAIRTTRELVAWGLAVFVAGVVWLPMIHLVDHRGDDHTHLLAHLSGADHDHGPGHGEGALEHFGLAWLDVDLPPLPAPVAGVVREEPLAPTPVFVIPHGIHPIRSQAP